MAETVFQEGIEKILVIHLAGLGDIVMSSPALRALRNKFPTGKIAVLVFAENDELVLRCPYINEVFVLKKGIFLKSFFWNISTFFKLRKRNFDIAINLYNLYTFWGAFKIFFMLSLIKPRKTLGRDTDGKGLFYDYKISERFNDPKHQVERMLEVVEFLGAKETDKRLEVWVSEERRLNLDNFLSQNHISKENFIIGLNPGAGRPSHRWPVENFAVLIDKLKNNYKAKIVITGSKNEISLARRIKELSEEDVFISSGEFSLADLVNFLRICRLYITNDTGPMHIANALGMPLVAVMAGGSENFYPYLKEKTVTLRKEIVCRPCYKRYCKSIECLKAISPEDAMNACEAILKQN